MRKTPLEAGIAAAIFGLTGFAERSKEIEMVRLLATRLCCRQHDRQHESLRVPDDLPEPLEPLAPTMGEDVAETL